jgi:hypothetical protein
MFKILSVAVSDDKKSTTTVSALEIAGKGALVRVSTSVNSTGVTSEALEYCPGLKICSERGLA